MGKITPISLATIGARDIFEGQARFSQIQYLYFSSKNKPNWKELKKEGMLEGIHCNAFDLFMKITRISEPLDVLDNSVSLFLLVCDISINAYDFFVVDKNDFGELINSHDPGTRFVRLCQVIKNLPDKNELDIKNYSSDEYWRISSLLCVKAGILEPKNIAKTLRDWNNNFSGLKSILEEEKNCNYSDENMPVRMLFSKFFSFQLDKMHRPEFFCWPGPWMTNQMCKSEEWKDILSLFDKHSALIIEKADGIVSPRKHEGIDESTVRETFGKLGAWMAVYDLARQWTSEPGEFNFDFSWITSKYPKEEMKAWAERHFSIAFGFSLSDIKIPDRADQ